MFCTSKSFFKNGFTYYTLFAMTINGIKAYIFFIICLSGFQLTAQIKSIGLPKIVNYTKAAYSGGSQNWDIGEDNHGNLYFANTSGLIQFNGTSWNTFSIPNKTVRSLNVDKNGKIYVGGYNEFGYFESSTSGKLIYHSISNLVSAGRRRLIDFVWKVHIVNNTVYFQTFSTTYIYKSGKISILEPPSRFQFSYVVDGTIYFQDIMEGLMKYEDGKLSPLPNTMVFNTTEVWGVLPFQGKSLLVVTQDKGMFVYDKSKVIPWDCEANNFLKKNNSLGGRMLNNRFIVLNSVLDGNIICDLNGKIVQHINNKKGLQNNTALSSFIDKSNNLWLGLDNGIAYVNENSPFTYLSSSFDLSTVYASVVYEGFLYVATNQGVFRHPWGNTFKEETFKFVEGTTGQAWGIDVIDGNLFCAHTRGLMQISGDGKIRYIDDKKGYLGLKKLPGRPDCIIASNYHGFSILRKHNNVWHFANQVKGFDISDSKFTTDGNNVWLKKNSVYKLKLSSDLTHFTSTATYENINNKLKGITSVQQLKGKTYFQINNRFFTYSAATDKFVEDASMTSNFKNVPLIRYCFEDNRGNICYFFGDSAMGMLMKNENSTYKNVLSPFSTLTGNLVYFFEAVNTVDNNNIFIGITDGLVHYNPKMHNGIAQKPTSYIRSFIFGSDTLVSGNLARVNPITIPYKDNNVKFNFSSAVYDQPENIRFSYKLEGFDDDWSKWTIVPVKEYTNLHEGNYRMLVKVINSYDIQSKPSQISFSVSPPFYRHWLAYLFYIVIIATGVYFVRRRLKTKIRQNRYYETLEQRKLYLEKETKIRQEQYELEKEIERLKNEQLRVKILTKDKELVNNSLQVVKKNKMLNGIVNRLKDIDSETLDEAAKVRFNKLYKTIDKELNTDKSWNNLEKHIRNVHFDFLKRLKEKYPAITPREMDLSTYLLMNMSTKEIAEIMNISDGGVELARYRLRKKLELSRKENLTGFLMSI
jgi:DNA-binding CsgD family transcriptional regulator/ligand-binding sensor domain-containing protein